MVLFEAGHCRYCNKEIFGGRSDKRFCGDSCRNAFNRERRKDEARLFEEDIKERIFKAIRKNYTLLLKFNRSAENNRIVDRQEIYLAGFNFAYYTRIEVFEGNRIRYFCFEQGWTDLEYGLIELSVDYDKIG